MWPQKSTVKKMFLLKEPMRVGESGREWARVGRASAPEEAWVPTESSSLDSMWVWMG